jgi:hypothetical protein
MNKNQRHNRPRKKEVPQDKWDDQLENLRRQYEYGERKKREKEEDGNNSQK